MAYAQMHLTSTGYMDWYFVKSYDVTSGGAEARFATLLFNRVIGEGAYFTTTRYGKCTFWAIVNGLEDDSISKGLKAIREMNVSDWELVDLE